MHGNQPSIADLAGGVRAVARMTEDYAGVSLAPIGVAAIRELWIDYELPQGN